MTHAFHRWTAIALSTALIFCFSEAAQATLVRPQSEQPTSTVGYPGQIKQLVIAGPELKTKPIKNRKQPLLVRILATYPHGSLFRYDLEFTGLEAGSFDLGQYLEPREVGESDWVPPKIIVNITATLPPGQVKPSDLAIQDSTFQSYYLASLVVGGVIWLAGLFFILFSGRGRIFWPKTTTSIITVADRLKPLLEKAAAGELSTAEQAELERVLVVFWQKKLRLSHLSAGELRTRLRKHPEAGKTLELIDRWLHQPTPDGQFDIDELIKPYQSVNYDEI